MANQIERLYGKAGLHALSVHPGGIRSRAQRYDDPEQLAKRLPELKQVLKTQPQGAATQVWAAVGGVWEGVGGKYLEDCREGVEVGEVSLFTGGYMAFAFDEEAEKKLWKVSCGMVDVNDE